VANTVMDGTDDAMTGRWGWAMATTR